MKKTVLLCLAIAWIWLAPQSARACDICGCGAGSYYIGILPEFNSKIGGIRYRNSELTTHLGPKGSRTYLTTDETYRVTELWGGWTIRDQFRIMAYVPVGINSKKSQVMNETKSGLSDISALAFWRPLRSKITLSGKESNKLLVQDLWIGGGIKLPTGKYNPADKSDGDISTNLFQLGTGSTDFILMGMYDIRLQDLGLNVTASYKINTVNKYDYYYGNRLSGSAQMYYKLRYNNKWMAAPNIGVQYESSAKDFDNGYSVRPTGGTAFFGTVGAEVSFEKFTVGGNYQPVLSQDMGHGAVSSGDRFMIHFSWLF